MSVIERIQILGIRSFGTDDRERQCVQFFRPLTLILGPNGSGKTTIIECLRYATTGDTPPNSERGGAFVHDPKLAGENEVKGQIRLRFRDVTGRTVVATRSLMVTQTAKKLTMKTLEGTISRIGANGEKIQLSSKCAEMDAEMVGSLGVSKAILNHVIFCHQEESNWPLSEGKALKQRFDEIFATTRYIKALDEIKKIRNEQMNEVKVFKTEVESLVSNKRKADEFQQELEKTEARVLACKDTIQGFEVKLQPISEKLLQIKIKQDEIGNLRGRLDKSSEIMKKYEKDEKDLRKSIADNLFHGSKEDLKEEMQNFDALVKQKRKKREKLKQDIESLTKKYDAEQKVKSKLLEELGRLRGDHERHKNLIRKRDQKLRVMRQKLGMGDIDLDDDEALVDTQVLSVMKNVKQRNSMTQSEFQNTKSKHEENERRLNKDLQEKCMEKAQKQMKLNSNNERTAKNKISIRNINDELSHLDSLANLQDNVEKELKEAEDELKTVEDSVNLGDLRQQLTAKQQKRDESETKLTVINEEMSVLQKESKIRHEIDLVSKEIQSKQDSVDKVMNKHKDTLVHLLQNIPEFGVYEKVTLIVSDLTQKNQRMNKDIEKETSKLVSCKTTKEFQLKQLSQKKELLTEHQNKIFDVCGTQDFENGLETLKDNIRELQNDKGALDGSLYLFNKYIDVLGKPRACCPLCRRSFTQANEATDLKAKLQEKVENVPAAVERKTHLINEKEKRLGTMLELKPIKEAVAALLEKEIPELENNLELITVDISEASSKISDLEENLDSISSDLKTASNLLPELVILDQNQSEIKRLNRKMSTLKTQIGGKDVSRTIQQVSDEQTALQTQLKSASREIDRIQQKINSHIEALQLLKSRVNDLKAEKNQMCSDMQTRSTILEQLDSLQKENTQYAEVVKDLKSEISKFEVIVRDLTTEKENATKTKERELEKLSNKIRDEERELDDIQKLSKEIGRYVEDDKETKLVEHEDQLKEVTSQLQAKTTEISKQNEIERELSQDINSQELKYRNLEDNMKLIEINENLGQMQNDIRNLKEKIGGYNIRSLNSDLESLLQQQRALHKERDEASGRETMLKEKVKEYKRQLRDDMFKDADKKHLHKCIDLRTTQLACDDLSKYYAALNTAIINYHQIKMAEINKIIRDLWIKTYAGNDIDYIEIQSNDDGEVGLEKARRSFNYKVVMFKGDTATDMRGRCSAGQKVLASLIIRLALAETFCLNCGILALDEPTTNLDRENICKLANALAEIVRTRFEQRNFQLIVITHDEDFIELLGRSDHVESFYRVSKDNEGYSKVTKLRITEVNH